MFLLEIAGIPPVVATTSAKLRSGSWRGEQSVDVFLNSNFGAVPPLRQALTLGRLTLGQLWRSVGPAANTFN